MQFNHEAIEAQIAAEVQAQLEEAAAKANELKAGQFEFLGKLQSYMKNDAKCYLLADTFFAAMFGDIKKYNLIAKLGDADYQNGKKKHYTLEKINERLLDYKVQRPQLMEEPALYRPFVEFMKAGGMNQIALILEVDQSFEVRDVSVFDQWLNDAQPEEDNDLQNQDEQQLQSAPIEEIEQLKQQIESLKAAIESKNTDMQTVGIVNRMAASMQSHIEESIQSVAEKMQAIDAAILAQNEHSDQKARALESSIENIAKETSENIAALSKSIAASDASNKATIERVLTAIETKAKATDSNFVALQDAIKKQQQELEAAKSELKAAKAQNGGFDDNLRRMFTNDKVWLRIAILVTCIFMPFTVAGLYKYIAFPTETWYAATSVFLLCVAIAAIWDGAIFLFTINGKKNLAAFGSVVQFVFFSAKFDFIAIVLNDIGGMDGMYWQKIAVILCAVTYSPLLLNQIAELAMSNKDKDSNND